jgi:hypothetical protein
MIGDNCQVAESHKAHAASNASPVDARNDRDACPAHSPRQATEVCRWHIGGRRKDARASRKVGTGAKGFFADSSQNDCPKGLIVCGSGHRRMDARDHVGINRVSTCFAIDCYPKRVTAPIG